MKRAELLPNLKAILSTVGRNIRLARLRRKITSEQLASQTGICRSTVFKVEKGNPTVAIGSYIQVLYILGLQNDFLKVAFEDEFGRKLQDEALENPKRRTKS